HNSIKLYDKGSILRCECTLNDPQDFRVYRPKEGDPEGPKAWRTLRYGIADLHRRATVCQAANERYLEALAAVRDTTPLGQLAQPLCQPVIEPTAKTRPATAAPSPVAPAVPAPVTDAKPVRPRRLRALNPLATADA